METILQSTGVAPKNGADRTFEIRRGNETPGEIGKTSEIINVTFRFSN